MRVMQQAKKDKNKNRNNLNRDNTIYNICSKSINKSHTLLTLLPLAILALLTTISFFSLSSSTTSADTSTSSTAKVNVAVACTLSGSTTTHAVEVLNGAYNDNITGTTLRTICNGSGNYNIYAVGYTNNTEGNNTLYSSTSGTIPTGTTLNGTTSNWAMKLANSTGNTATIENNYNTFQVVPSTSTLVASYNATTSNQTTDSTLATTYGVSISPNQPAGTYTGAVKYTMNYTEYVPPLSMQDFSASNFNSMNIGDTATLIDNRTGFTYDVAMLNLNGTKTLWMTSNLKLPAGTTLKPTDSNVSANFTLSTESWTSSSQNYFCKQIMAVSNGEYYYNWYAANANPYECDSPTIKTNATATNDAKSLGDICPKNWRIPDGDSEVSNSDWLNDIYANGSLALTGYFSGGEQWAISYQGTWNSSTRFGEQHSITLDLARTQVDYSYTSKTQGFSVRCMRTS